MFVVDKLFKDDIDIFYSGFETSENIPILLGDNYSEYYKNGNIIHAFYFGREMTFEVSGFFEKDACVFVPNEKICLNDFLLT